jgi:hypothetical protein
MPIVNTPFALQVSKDMKLDWHTPRPSLLGRILVNLQLLPPIVEQVSVEEWFKRMYEQHPEEHPSLIMVKK